MLVAQTDFYRMKNGSSSAHRISSAPFGSGDNGNCSICHLPEELEFQVLKASQTDG
uniref:HDC06121 n=1 Tax=Drosophila melanogaster TaxID=7227 RepID=Q6IGJ9_DROME|nr:TPA_inf: HDC06121 [Drosophila melanogaster]